jgi:hypothetical protein
MSERDEILVAAILQQAERSRAWLVDSIVIEPLRRQRREQGGGGPGQT